MKKNFLIRAAFAAFGVVGTAVLLTACAGQEGDAPEVPRGAYIEDKNVDVPPVPEVTEQETVPTSPEVLPEPQPAPQPEIKKGPSDISYRVQGNDTLGSIAAVYCADQQAIASYNGLKAPYQLKPGQLILIPASAIGKTDARPIEDVKNYEAPNAVEKKAAPATTGHSVTHVVGQGEYLGMIARGYGVKVADICSVNGMKNANQIRVGQRLVIPNPTKTWTKPAAAKKKPAAVKKPAAAKKTTKSVPVEKPATPKKAEPAVQPAEPAAADGPSEDELLDEDTPAPAPEAPKSEPVETKKVTPPPADNVFQCKMEAGSTLRKFSTSVSIPLEKLQQLNPNLDADTPVTEAVMVNCPY